MLNENVKKLLKENMWDLATCSAGVPNAVPVAFKDVTDDGKLVVGDVFLDTTLRNLHTCIRGETAVCCRQQTAERSHFYAHCSSL